jgi:hypothetical protein
MHITIDTEICMKLYGQAHDNNEQGVDNDKK